MKSLILPCAGRSTRFPGMRPKWLLTYPDGKLMIEKAIEQLDLQKFDRVIIPILREHAEHYQAELILRQVFGNSVEILLVDPTNGPAQTVSIALRLANVQGPFVVKDCDNSVVFDWIPDDDFVVGMDIQPHFRNLPAKSYLITNDQGFIIDIVEKRIVSNTICLGVYGFQSPDTFLDALSMLDKGSEVFVSHVIAYLIGTKRAVFQMVTANSFEDWGTLEDWKAVQQRHTTYFCDIDGVIFENVGQYGENNWTNFSKPLHDNIAVLLAKGGQIIFTSTRPEALRDLTMKNLIAAGFTNFQLILGCNHAPRILINDFAITNPYPSASAVNVPRNGSLRDYI